MGGRQHAGEIGGKEAGVRCQMLDVSKTTDFLHLISLNT